MTEDSYRALVLFLLDHPHIIASYEPEVGIVLMGRYARARPTRRKQPRQESY